MAEDCIAIVDLADELQVRKQRIFKIIKRLGIRPTQRREPTRGNQNIAVISQVEAATIRKQLTRADVNDLQNIGVEQESALALYYSDEVGVFYLIQLEPDHDQGRFKVGFTTDLDGRLRKHRCSAPFAHCIKSWPCRRTWERAAIDCITSGCEQLHTEVFRADSVDEIAGRADVFLLNHADDCS